MSESVDIFPTREAVEAAGNARERLPDLMRMRHALTAAYAVDIPSVRAGERAATLRAVDRLLSECSRDFAGAHVNAGAVTGSIRRRLREHFNQEAET